MRAIPSTIALCLLLSGLPAQAQPSPIAYIKTASGIAWVRTAGERVAARPGVPVYLGSQLQTQDHASLGLSFQDDTVMSLGPDSELTVDEYLYAPEHSQLSLVASLLRGSLNYISGLIAKLRPDAVSVRTPDGIIGVRGTQFVVNVAAASP